MESLKSENLKNEGKKGVSLDKTRALLYGAAVSDFDGTLARDDKTISEKTLAQIREYSKSGGLFALCTGRMTSATLPVCRKYNLCDYAISFQGAAINEVKSGKSLYFNPVECEVAARLADYAKKTNRNMQVYLGKTFICLKRSAETDIYAAAGGLTYEDNCDLGDYIRKLGQPTGKALFHVGKEDPQKLRDEIAQVVGEDYNVFISNPMHIDIVRAGVSKADGIKRLLKILGRENEKFMCFGDASNDLPMLKIADFAVAPQNAEDIVKNAVDFVCESNNEGGVGNALERFAYIREE